MARAEPRPSAGTGGAGSASGEGGARSCGRGTQADGSWSMRGDAGTDVACSGGGRRSRRDPRPRWTWRPACCATGVGRPWCASGDGAPAAPVRKIIRRSAVHASDEGPVARRLDARSTNGGGAQAGACRHVRRGAWMEARGIDRMLRGGCDARPPAAPAVMRVARARLLTYPRGYRDDRVGRARGGRRSRPRGHAPRDSYLAVIALGVLHGNGARSRRP